VKPFNRTLKNRSNKSVVCTSSFYIKTPVSNKAPSTRIRFYLKTTIFSPWLPSNFSPHDGLSKPFRFAHLHVSTSVWKQIFFSGLQKMLPRYNMLKLSFFDSRACTTKYKISGWPTNSFYSSLDVLPGIILGIIISWDTPHPYQSPFCVLNRPAYSRVLSILAFEYTSGWGWHCFDTNLFPFLVEIMIKNILFSIRTT